MAVWLHIGNLMSSDDQRIFFTVLSWVLYLPLPAFFLLSLWRHKGTQFWPWLLQATLCGAYILFIFLIGAWPLVWGYWVREILILGFAVVAIKSLLNMLVNILNLKERKR